MNHITARYLRELSFQDDELVSVNHQPPGGNFSSTVLPVRDVPAQVAKWSDHCCWIGANPIRRPEKAGRGSAEDVVGFRALYADLDYKTLPEDAVDAVIADLSDMLEAQPVAVVMSGHGKQPRWAVDDEFDWERATALSKRFGQAVKHAARLRGGAADSVHDLARVLRAPGTMNTKDPDHPVATDVEFPGGWAMDYDHIDKSLDKWDIPEVREAVAVEPVPVDPDKLPAMQRYIYAAVRKAADTVAAETSERNKTLNTQVFSVATIAAHDPSLVDKKMLYGEMARACNHNGLLDDDGHRSFNATFESGWNAGLQKPRENWPPKGMETTPEGEPAQPRYTMRSWDDLGNAQRLVDHHPGKLLWVQQAGEWAVWDGQKWVMDTTSASLNLASKTIAALPDTEAALYSDAPAPPKTAGGQSGPSDREKFLAWVAKQRYHTPISNMLKMVRGLDGMSVDITDFDRDPMLLNCRNGILDLETLELLPHSPKHLQMQQVRAAYDPDARAPLWEAFLEKMHPNREVRDYLKRAIGYSLTGNISEQKMFMHLGEGANGKSVFLEVMTGLFGSYGQSIPRTTLLVKKHEGISNDIARMRGKRFLQTSETGKGQQLDEEQVKGLTGGEEQSARFMRQEFFDFKPSGKIHYVTNHFPKVSDAPSLWRRMVIIKWLTIIADDDPGRDRFLGQKIVAQELEGVLAWAVEGLKDWYLTKSLGEPAIVRSWAAEYKDEADDFGDFLADCTITDPSVAFTSVSNLFDSYRDWMERGSRGAPMSVKAFSTAMKERNFTMVRKAAGRGFSGVRAIPPHRVGTMTGWISDPSSDS